ncbi:Hypothetical predicted protein [Cloeon dipterum]|uniref:Uncharacterized protein n=1 Tax=Cloeon dipterum TaxID=197152 RepID=A0A8S1D3P1_9INSE|nr:Hypothetical predicted protein [Cloeon dipterum]
MEKSAGRDGTGWNISWIPKTPSTVETGSTGVSDWLKKNKQKCETCSKGGKKCCRRDFKYPCLPNCECVLIQVWANLTLTDNIRKDNEERRKYEKKFPPAPRISCDQKFLNAWRVKPAVTMQCQKWHSLKRSIITPPTKDTKGINYLWQGWDHYDSKKKIDQHSGMLSIIFFLAFATTASNYGGNPINQDGITQSKPQRKL